MSVTIKLTVSDELNDQVEIVCGSKSATKQQWITGLIRKEISTFFKKQEKEIIRKSWCIEERVSNKNLKIVCESVAIPPAY